MNWGRVFFGGIILGVGVILLLGNADLIDTGEVFGVWWPIVLVFAGVVSFLANPRHWSWRVSSSCSRDWVWWTRST